MYVIYHFLLTRLTKIKNKGELAPSYTNGEYTIGGLSEIQFSNMNQRSSKKYMPFGPIIL